MCDVMTWHHDAYRYATIVKTYRLMLLEYQLHAGHAPC
jgi:hypothetical protein